MSEAILARRQGKAPSADKALRAVAGFWFVVAFIGQWLFVGYMAVVYGGTALAGNAENWGKTSLRGYEAGDVVGNAVFAAHILMAAVLTVGGTLQLIPQIRARAIGVHRWNGRVFLTAAAVTAIGGFYLVWVREAVETLALSFAITLNGILILAFAGLAWRNARGRDFAAHRRWAMRAFVVVNGVWFFRLGYMAWVLINRGPVGMTRQLDGPFDLFWGFGNFLIPLAVMELYLRVQDRGGPAARWAMSAGLLLLTLLMALGIFGAALMMWWPRIAKVI